jgi:hypothetical protein
MVTGATYQLPMRLTKAYREGIGPERGLASDRYGVAVTTLPQRPWQLWAAVTAVAGLIAGLMLTSVETVYDLSHYDRIITATVGDDPSMTGPAEAMLDQDLDDLSLIVVGIAALALVVAATGLLLRQRWAYPLTLTVAAPFVACCGYASVGSGTADPASPPEWVRLSYTVGPLSALGCAVLVVVLLLLPPVRRTFRKDMSQPLP